MSTNMVPISSEIARTFNELAIRQASLDGLIVESQTKVVLRLTSEDAKLQVLNVLELQFNGVVDVLIDVVGTPWFGPLKNHNAMPADEIEAGLRNVKPTVLVNGPLTRFSIDYAQGHLEVLAQQYTLVVVRQIPKGGGSV